jgi:hypothetical protein
LIKVFIQLQSTTPYEVAKAFLDSILDSEITPVTNELTKPAGDGNSNNSKKKENEDNIDDPDNEGILVQNGLLDTLHSDDILYAIQFCHLCTIGKILLTILRS